MANKPVIMGTGFSGMVGSSLTKMFADQYSFVNLDLSQGIDITKTDQVNSVLSRHPSTVLIHLAAFTDVSKAYEQQGDKNGSVYKVNTLGTKNIAQACQQYNHYLIHISTDFVFDGQKSSAYTEADQPHPIEWYGQTKYWAEQAVLKSNCQASIVRISYPFTSYYPPKKDLVRNILEKLKTNSLHPMFKDSIITPTFMDDLCQGLNVFIQKKPQGIYHLVGSGSVSPYDLAQKIAHVFNLKADIKASSFKDFIKKDPRPRHQSLIINNQKIKEKLGITMSTLDQALKIFKSQF